jgi:hypothetical protein
LVEEDRILAIRGMPAETRPNQQVDFEALIASPSGTLTTDVEWAFCLEPRRAEERTGVTASCAEGESLQSISNPALVPSDACARFGPNPPPSEEDEPPLRPADPDPSGGYFLPVRALTSTSDEVISFGFQRLQCDLSGATRAIFDEYLANYAPNQNPEVATVEAMERDEPAVDARAGVTVSPGSTLTFRLEATAESTEPFVVYMAEDSRLDYRNEAITVSWYLTGGELLRASQTLSAEEIAAGARFQTEWQAPSGSAELFGWAVVRDSRGGSGWADFTVRVR